MKSQHSWSLLAAGVLAYAVIGVTPRPASAQLIGSVTGDHHKLPVTAVGCLQREKEYRQAHDSGKGRSGQGDEYILVNATVGVASMHVEPATEAESNNCLASPDNGQAIELTGHGEKDLDPLVGRRVVITGMLKNAKHDPEAVGTSGAFTPVPRSGGHVGSELHLREINVDSFALAPVIIPRREAAIAPAEPEPVVSAPEPSPEPVPAPQAPQVAAAPELPKTASPLPTIGLIGLLSLAGAFGLRLLGRERLS
jgi:hypothetical protein